MNLSQEKALFHLTGQTDTAALASVQQIVDEYPYFAPAQCLLAYHFKQEEHPMVVLQTLRTALYFTNPYWLQYQLQDDGLKRPASYTPPVIPLISKPQPAPESAQEMISQEIEPPADLPALDSRIEGPILTEVPEDRPAAPADIFPEAQPPVPAPTIFTTDLTIPTVEAVKEMMRNIDPVTETQEEKEANETLPLPVEEDRVGKESGSLLDDAGVETGNKIASILSEQLADFKKPVEPDARLDLEALPEKKLHTIDYFASQGIKIDLAAIPQDKLTHHLRKFTDWLKQVKQGELTPRDLLAGLEMEQQVVKTAQHSNESDEIITEAMAEVLEKQGQTDKAIDVYAKLSFLNPEKSSYFAAKIEHLKGI